MNEVWRDVVGFEGLYQVSNFGRVKGKRGMRKPVINPSGYPQIILWKNNKHTTTTLHRLVALAFIGNPEGKETVNHIDGNKLNCNVNNLEWNTHAENIAHAHATNLSAFGERHGRSKLTEELVRQIRNDYDSKEYTQMDLSKKYGIARSQIQKIIAKKAWKNV